MQQLPDYTKCFNNTADLNRAFEECVDVRFVYRVFSYQPMLEQIEPDDSGNVRSIPFTGAAYDTDEYRLVEDGWDHEHCFICYQKIEAGDEYWANESPGICPDLCVFCFQELQKRLG